MSIELDKRNAMMVALGIVFLLLSIVVTGSLSSVSISSPSAGSTVSGDTTITASVADHATQVTFYYQASGGSSWNQIGSPVTNDTNPDTSFSTTWNTENVEDGTYTLNATAYNGSTYAYDTNENIVVDNIQVEDPINLEVSDAPNDQGGSLDLSWDWDGSADNLETFTIERRNEGASTWSFLANTTSKDYTDDTASDNSQAYCYHVRAVGTDGSVSSWTSSACAEPNAEPVMGPVSIEPENPTIQDSVYCVGWTYDIDDGAPTADYVIWGSSYWGRTISQTGTITCIGSGGSQWPDMSPPDETHTWYLCEVQIQDIRNAEKYNCRMTPEDSMEYGEPNETVDYTYINNSRPYASDVHVEPEDPDSNSVLTCNYTFNDYDYGQEENVSEAKFKWYKNIDGQNNWIQIEDQTDRTLENTDTETLFSKDDQIKCSVKVKDVDVTWPGKDNPLYDSQYRNVTNFTVIGGNEEPGIINDWNNANTTEDRIGIGEYLNFSVEWIDDNNEVRLRICEDFVGTENQYVSGSENISFGGQNEVWFYSNQTGLIADRISIKPFSWEGKTNSWINQEDANSTSIEGYYTNSWTNQEDANSTSFSGSWTDPSNATDGDWNTYSNSTSGEMYFNYSKITNAQDSSLWKVKGGNNSATETNLTISSSCWSQSILQFRANMTSDIVYWDCYNGSSWETLDTTTFSGGEPRLYEESMIWNVSTYHSWTDPSNATDGDWNTYSNSTSGEMYFNYSKITNAQDSSLWKVKGGNNSATETNLTISSSCWSQSILQFRANMTSDIVYWDCYNGSSWETLDTTTFSGGEPRLYEESMIWNVSTVLTNTNHTYDIYAYEVNSPGNLTPGTQPGVIAKVNDVAFTMNEYNTFNLEYNAGVYPDKYIAFKICVDSDNDESCDSEGKAIYVHANTTGDYEVKEKEILGGSTRTLYNPDIEINYDTSTGGCRGTLYCNTTLTSDRSE
ncbi:MAG: Ig-like domain-containing protein, partial [Candidatus Aenigmatarchaeota archaeon]